MAILHIPYAVAGAWVGLLQGYCYALRALVEPLEPVVPAVAWITKPLAMVLPDSAVHHHHAEGQAAGQPLEAGQAPPAASSSVVSAAAPAAPDALVPPSATAATVHFSEPLVPAPPQAAAPAAPAEADRDAAAASMTAAAAAAVAAAAEAAAADPHAPTAERLERLQRNFAECRVESFAIDDLSPTNTTATAMSSLLCYTGGGLTPGGPDLSAVAPLDEAVEGELELTITHSNSSNLWQHQQAAPAGDTGTAPPAPLDTAADTPAQFGSAGAAGSRATDRSRQTDQTSPTKAARQQHNKGATAGFAGFAQPQQPGSSRSACAVGRPAQRHQLQPHLSDGSTASSCSSHGAAASAAIGRPVSPMQPQQQQPQHKALGSSSAAAAAPAAGAGSSKLTVSLPAAAAADLDEPLSPSSLSSIHTTDSMGTVERKKKRGLFASLKQKALKGRQQVR